MIYKIIKFHNITLVIAVYVYFFIFHLFFTRFSRDDFFFANVINQIDQLYDFLDFLKFRYETWSSRTLSEILCVLLTSLPVIVWKIIDSAIFTGVIVLIAKIVDEIFQENAFRFNFIVSTILVIFLFPIFDMKTAGWVSTTVNYIWPFLSLLYLVLFSLRFLHGLYHTRFQKILFIVCCVYAGTHELILMCEILVLGIVCIQAIMKKLPITFLASAFLIGIFFLLYDLFCPGNAVRNVEMISTFFPSWLSFDAIEHVTFALASTFSRLTGVDYFAYGVQPFILYLLFNLLILISVHLKWKNLFLDFLMFLPFVFIYLFNNTDVRFGEMAMWLESIASIHTAEFRYVF